MERLTGPILVLLCIVAAVPWTFIVDGTDLAFVLFALAPPILLLAGIGLRTALSGREGIRTPEELA